jgi:hypothetical protein
MRSRRSGGVADSPEKFPNEAVPAAGGELIVLPRRRERESSFTKTSFPRLSTDDAIWAGAGAGRDRNPATARIAIVMQFLFIVHRPLGKAERLTPERTKYPHFRHKSLRERLLPGVSFWRDRDYSNRSRRG